MSSMDAFVSTSVAVVNIVLGLAYVGYGVMTAIEMRRDWSMLGFSHFGLAWIFMAFTCGPHHLAHGVHVAFEGRSGAPLDLFSVAFGLPLGVIWLLLRIEAFAGGRGDRFIAGTPRWLRAIPAVAATYFAVVAIGIVLLIRGAGDSERWSLAPVSIALVGLYLAIGYFLLRTQLRTHPQTGGWSLSGLSLSGVFPTCAAMHGVFAAYSVSGTYHHDIHGAVIDVLSVPSAAYFLWVVRRLYHDSLRDWNREVEAGPLPVPQQRRPASKPPIRPAAAPLR